MGAFKSTPVPFYCERVTEMVAMLINANKICMESQGQDSQSLMYRGIVMNIMKRVLCNCVCAIFTK